MGLLTQTVKIKINSRTKKIYSEKGYDVGSEFVEVNVLDLSPKSNVKVEIVCDYCGKLYTQSYGDYLKGGKTIDKSACCMCKYKKVKDVVGKLYDVENVSQLNEVKIRKVESCKEHFGCEYPMQSRSVQLLSKETMIRKYGVEHNLYREDVKNNIRIANANKRYEHGNTPCSKAQKHLCDLYDGLLNYPVGWYNLDILLSEKIYIEYNGSGHDMNVKMGQVSKEEFSRKEFIRYAYIKKFGYKEIIFDNPSDKLPPDTILVDIKNKCVEYLCSSIDANWIRINLDTGRISIKNAEIFYGINEP